MVGKRSSVEQFKPNLFISHIARVKIKVKSMGLIDLKRIHELKALADWRFYCHLAEVVEHHYARLENLAIVDAVARLRKTE